MTVHHAIRRASAVLLLGSLLALGVPGTGQAGGPTGSTVTVMHTSDGAKNHQISVIAYNSDDTVRSIEASKTGGFFVDQSKEVKCNSSGGCFLKWSHDGSGDYIDIGVRDGCLNIRTAMQGGALINYQYLAC